MEALTRKGQAVDNAMDKGSLMDAVDKLSGVSHQLVMLAELLTQASGPLELTAEAKDGLALVLGQAAFTIEEAESSITSMLRD